MEEGGQPARLARYEANAKELLSGMAKLGFTTYLSPDKQGCIISTFREASASACCVQLSVAASWGKSSLHICIGSGDRLVRTDAWWCTCC